jgi:hypothetical protein
VTAVQKGLIKNDYANVMMMTEINDRRSLADARAHACICSISIIGFQNQSTAAATVESRLY